MWLWQDPLTGAYTAWHQRNLAEKYEALIADPSASSEAAARNLRRRARNGAPIGRLRIGRLGLDVIVVAGTDSQSLRMGPGWDDRTALPGEHELVYVAGHRTTYLAPFANIDRLRRGDRIVFSTPYASFTYVVSGHRIVESDDLSVLRSPGREVLRLQACHPRFFASKRYVVEAEPAGQTSGRRGRISA
jgi:sortase A